MITCVDPSSIQQNLPDIKQQHKRATNATSQGLQYQAEIKNKHRKKTTIRTWFAPSWGYIHQNFVSSLLSTAVRKMYTTNITTDELSFSYFHGFLLSIKAPLHFSQGFLPSREKPITFSENKKD